MEKSSQLYSVKIKLKNNEEYLIGLPTMTEAQNLLVRLEEDDSVLESRFLSK